MRIPPNTNIRRFNQLRNSVSMVLAALLAFAATAPAQTDNFNYTAPPLAAGWTTSISVNYPGTLSSPADVFGGNALRMQTTNQIPLPAALSFVGSSVEQSTPRIFAWRTDQTYTNFYVAVDLVNWNTSTDRNGTNDCYVGIIARATNVVAEPLVPVGQPDGLAFIIDYNRFGGLVQGTRGIVQIAYLTAGQPSVADLALQGEFTLNPGHSYRLVFTGTNQLDEFNVQTNDIYYGRVYDLQDLTRPLATVFTSQPGGRSWAGSGYSGIFSLGKGLNDSTDVTYDNFVASEYPPTSVNFPATPHGLAGVPQVVNRTPFSWTNFYPASGGINFTATTLTANTIATSAIRLFLNGVDVSSGLSFGGTPSSRSVTYSGLTSNVVYDARIELTNNLGQKTTNSWTFDTFREAHLASAACKNIECEDIDSNGTFVDENPIASGYLFPVTYANRNGLVWPWVATVINQGPNSYVLKPAVRAASPASGGDFWDAESGLKAGEADYRTNSFGNSQGCADFLYNNNNFPGVYSTSYTFDTQRQKYSSVDADLQEYFVRRNQGGDWYNYTRTFAGTNYYNVYLRHGCDLTSKYQLGQMTPGGMSVPTSTNVLGTFYLTNAFTRSNFRYARLLDGSGNLAVVNLSGVNTLRLLMNEVNEERTVRSSMLNYLAFVPALIVESSAQANTGYAFDASAIIEPITQTITIPQSGAARFYRLRWDHTVTITSINLVGGNVVLTYQ